MIQKLTRKHFSFSNNPARVISGSFALVILVGSLLLMLPISSKSGEVIPFINALFTATSATCVTGLIVYDTFTQFTVFGQLVVILLIQIGGLGLVTITTFFSFLLGHKLGLRSMIIAQESISSDNMGNVKSLIRLIVLFSLGVEAVGALVLSTVFVPQYGLQGIFISIFTAISAYCNAGFDIMGRIAPFTSLTTYVDNTIIVLGVCSLIVIGGLGFAVWYDVLNYRKTKKLTLHAKLVLMMTGILIVVGTVLFLVFEWKNPKTLGDLSYWGKFLGALFQSVTMRTAGFNTIPLEHMFDQSKLGSIFLMFIGAAPGSTGGGIKVTTFAVILMTVIGVMRGQEDTIILGRRIGKEAVYKAFGIFFMAVTVVIVSVILIYFEQIELGAPMTAIDVAFEEVSAFATVGASVGISPQASFPSKCLLIFSMYFGRVGPVSLALSFTARALKRRKEVLPEGKIIIA